MKAKRHTKGIVIIGFIIMIALCMLGIALIYFELLNFSKYNGTSTERTELVTANSLLVSLYKVESVGNLLMISASPDLKNEYDSLMQEAHEQIELLKSITNDTVVMVHLDRIAHLLDLKKANVQRMASLLDSINTEFPKEIVKKTVISGWDCDNLEDILQQSVKKVANMIMEDSTFVLAKRKGFMDRVRNVFVPKTDSSLVVSKTREERKDSLLIPVLIDTLTQYIQELSWKYEERHWRLTQQLANKQNLIYEVNRDLSSQISILLHSLEERKQETSMSLLKEKETTLKRSSRIVAIIGFLAIITVLAFLIMSLTSITHSQRYREQLEDAKKYSEDLLDARERLIFSITHDIKAPISSIIGYMELLSKNKLSKKEEYYVENMQHSAEHILELVRNLLDYHSLESDKQEIQNMPFYPVILLKDIYRSFVPMAQKSGINLLFDCQLKEDQGYESDPLRIRQIVENLLSNAIKFTGPKGKVVFSASFAPVDENVDLIRLSVKDTGPGIEKEYQEIIFDEFTRLDSRKSTIEGTGLGLPIAKKIVNRLNGTISVDSELGKGSEFTVEIPLKKTGEKQYDSTATSSPVYEITHNEEKKILFIDDDIVLLNLYSELLKNEGFQITICQNSLDALSLIQTNRFDLIFSDIQMPDMNGFELVERIRMGTFAGAQIVPVVALSGNSDISEQKFKEAGFSAFISKPFTSESILGVIRQLFRAKDYQSPSLTEKKERGFAALLEFAPEDVEAGKAIIHSFINESNKNIQIITDALAGNDWESIKKTAHRMLPLMRMISAEELVSVLVELEKGSTGHEKVDQLVQLTKKQLQAAEEFLKTI